MQLNVKHSMYLKSCRITKGALVLSELVQIVGKDEQFLECPTTLD